MTSENPSPEASGSPTPSWAMLLARWTQFAQAAVAIPPEADGARWRATVAPAIGLQAVALAVGDLTSLAAPDRPLALDMAQVLTRRHAGELHQAWRGVEMPSKLRELIDDAIRAIDRASSLGQEWTVQTTSLIAPRLDDWVRAVTGAGFSGDVLAAPPGTILFAGEPMIFIRPALPDGSPPLPGAESLMWSSGTPRQVYRQICPSGGRVERDVIAPLDAQLPPGRPLLTPLIESGRAVAQHDDDAATRWLAAQQAMLPQGPPDIVVAPSA